MYKIFVKNVFNETLKNLPQMLKKSFFFILSVQGIHCISKVLQLSKTIQNSNLKNDWKLKTLHLFLWSFPNSYKAKILTNHCISSSSKSYWTRPPPRGRRATRWASGGAEQLRGARLENGIGSPWKAAAAAAPRSCTPTPSRGGDAPGAAARAGKVSLEKPRPPSS